VLHAVEFLDSRVRSDRSKVPVEFAEQILSAGKPDAREAVHRRQPLDADPFGGRIAV